MNSRYIKVLVVFALLVGGGYAAGTFFRESSGIPKEFTDARLEGALISANIVELANKSATDIATINELERQGKFTEAIALASDAIEQSQEIRNQAILLSEKIETMTKSLAKVPSSDARQALLEGVTNHLALLSRLISYSGYLGQLLDTLKGRFAGTIPRDHEVAKLVEQINAEAKAINSFNDQAVQAMERFDTILKRG